MEKLRVILDLAGRDVYWSMAIDEALLELRRRDKIPDTLRVYVINPSAVTIGYFQKISESVNLDYLRVNNIGITRRITGGGAVYHDSQGELTYGVVLPVAGMFNDVNESFKIICNGIVLALKLLNVEATFVPINDVTVHGRKISGSAQTRRGDFLLQHGTLMYGTDIDILEKVLKVPSVKLSSKGISRIRERVITLHEVLGKRISKEELAFILVKGFSHALAREAFYDEYTEEELNLASELVEKYKDSSWIFKR